VFLKEHFMTSIRIVFWVLSLLLLSSSGHAQYKVISIDTQSVLLFWDHRDAIVEDIFLDEGEVEYFSKNDSLYIHVYDLTPSTVTNLHINTISGNQHFENSISLISQSKSSGDIRIFFNRPVDSTFKRSDYKPDGTSFVEVQTALRNAIRNAKSSVDLAAYNTNEIFLVNELIDAYNRGVRVRVITDDETSNTGWSGGVPFPVLYGNQGSGLMHNKFLIIDPLDAESSLLVTGSMNFTSNQMRKDPNHLIFIQDQSLAKAYTLEFEEMWGGSGSLPNTQSSKFGSQKKKNTPTYFNINGVMMELYFSPSDSTTHKIGEVIEKVQEQILLALMIFTNWELRDVVREVVQKGVSSRWIVDDASSSSSVINALRQAGTQVFVHEHPDIFHHKYAILDEGGTNPVVITGSHNWTFAAETVNDENTLIIYDEKTANIFRQEFEARWKEFSVNVSRMESSEVNIFPNPTTGIVSIEGADECPKIFDSFGKQYEVFQNRNGQFEWKGSPGMYFVLYKSNVMKIIRL